MFRRSLLSKSNLGIAGLWIASLLLANYILQDSHEKTCPLLQRNTKEYKGDVSLQSEEEEEEETTWENYMEEESEYILPQSAKIIDVKLTKPPHFCHCKQVDLKMPGDYEENLNLTIPWLNISNKEHLQRHHPNFPVSIATELTKNRCHLMPAPHSISWTNTYYQKVVTEGGTTYQLYSATMDNRFTTKLRPCVRILAYTRNKNPELPWCYFWFNATGPPTISKVAKGEFIALTSSKNTSYTKVILLTCQIPFSGRVIKPKAISVVPKPCDSAVTLMEVVGAVTRNNKLAHKNGLVNTKGSNLLQGWNAAVCGTALFYYHNDYSIRLVEWIEILRAMGFSKVFLHETDVHPNISKVLSHYENEGILHVTKFSYPEPYVNEPSTRRMWYIMSLNRVFPMGVMYYTDCLLRHMHEYRFIAHLDPDEIPILPGHDSYLSWMDYILKRAQKTAQKYGNLLPAAYGMEWIYHPDDLQPSKKNRDIPSYLWALRHSFASTEYNPGKIDTKCLYDMNFVTAALSHSPVSCDKRKYCKVYRLARSKTYIGHFKFKCGDPCRLPKSTTEYPALLKYRETVESAVVQTLQKLHLI